MSAGWGSPIGSRTFTKSPGVINWSGLSILARNRRVPVFRSTRLSVKSTMPWWVKIGLAFAVLLVGEADLDGHFLLRPGLELASSMQAADPSMACSWTSK